MKNILLRGSWQTKNIGDIAHTPGFLSLAARFLPECKVWLWPCQIDLGVREMLLENFPGLRIVESEADLNEAFETCDLLVNGSGPCIEVRGIRAWKEKTGKPYGFFGVSADGFWSDEKKTAFSEAAFIFCRDSLSEYFLKQQKLQCPVISFAPDSTFGLKLKRDDSADLFLKENGLEDGKFVCVIPRIRCTPASFDEDHFYYTDPEREAPSMEHIESDMAKMREVICHIVENCGLKVLICPEMTYQVPMGRRYLYERLPESVRKNVVLKREYWITSEAESVYSKAKMLVSMEMHSPIIFIGEHKPAILLRQAEDTWKGQMWRDLGLQDWILELNVTDASLIKDHVDRILQDYPAALRQAEAAGRRAMEADAKALAYLRSRCKMNQQAYIPEPQNVHSDIEISAFYYPGTEQMAEWDQVEQTLPGIKPLLGWYDESNPEVIDWQIKWAVEHGISSFCVDWYWNKGVQRLDHWVKAYYKARFRKHLKWYMMYANGDEFGSHSTEDQKRVTQFWLENYLKTPEYYTIGGKPVIVYWSVDNLDRDFIAEAAAHGEKLSSGEGAKRALAISDRMAREAGLPGLYFISMYHGWEYHQEKVDLAERAGFSEQMIYNFDSIACHLAPEAMRNGDTDRKFHYDCVMKAAPKWWEMTSGVRLNVPIVPILPTGWNDTPRSFEEARVISGRTPEKFHELCSSCRDFCKKHGIRKVIAAPVNEWQEGSYIEPNEEFGFGMYDAMRDAFCTEPEGGFPENLLPRDIGRGPYDYPPMEHPACTEWDFSKGMQGWYRNPYGTAFLQTVGDHLHYFHSYGKRMAIRTRVAPFRAEQFTKFQVEMRITPSPAEAAAGNEKMRLRWGTAENPVFSKDLVLSDKTILSSPVHADGEWHTYELFLKSPYWKGLVDELWFDAAPLALSKVDIRRMAFL